MFFHGNNFGSWGEGYSVTTQTDGKILVAGTTEPNTYNSSALALARYNTDGTLDTSFLPSNTLNGSPVYREREYTWYPQPYVVLDSDVRINDTQLDAIGNYSGATLTLSRHGGPNAEDVFNACGATLSILKTDSYFAVDSTTIGRVTTNDAGTLTLSFNANATQSLVNKAMQQIGYGNTSEAPPTSVQIDWTFNDGNTGSQGTGGALSVTGSTTVQITAVNDPPQLVTPLPDQNLTVNLPFNFIIPIDTFTDPDNETLNYSFRMADGTGAPPWLSFNPANRSFSGTPDPSDIGSAIEITVSATDGYYISYDNFTITVLPTDTTAPRVSSFNPLDGAIGVSTTTNIILTFDEAIQPGSGNILLRTSTGTIIETFPVTSSKLTFSGSTLTINPTSDLAPATGYKVEVDAGSIKDLANNPYDGTTSYDFTTAAPTDTTAPTVSTFSPADEASGVAIASNIVVTFNEAIARGTGSIVLKTSVGTTVATYDAATSSNLTISGSTLTINPTSDLAPGTGYKVEFATGSIKDIAGNSYDGTTSYDFTTAAPTDTTAPTVSTFSPADEASGVAIASNIVVTFNEAIARGTGNIVLKTAAGATVATYDSATSTNLSIAGSTLIINPTADLANSTGYKVELSQGTIKDIDGNNYAGTTSYNFTTTAALDTTVPTVSTFFPADGASSVTITSNIILNFNEGIQRGTGNIVLETAAGVIVETFNAATSSQLSVSGSTFTIDPTSPLTNGTHYYLTLEAGTVKDVAGNAYTGTATYDFTTIQQVLNGTNGNNTLRGGLGNDIFNGEDGVDTVVLSGLPSQYKLRGNDLSGIEGSDTVDSIEQYRFGSSLGDDDKFMSNLNADYLIDPDGDGPADSLATDMLQGISDLYVAYFNRAPDVKGLMYWFGMVINNNWTLSEIAKSFADQDEYRATYPEGLSNRDFIKKIYQNLFDRDPDAAGWDYWENDLNNGMPRDGFIHTVILGAYAPTGGASDRVLLNNKHDVSLYYSEQLATSAEGFDYNITQVLNRVTTDTRTVEKAEAVIDYVIDNPITLTGLITDTPAWEAFWV